MLCAYLPLVTIWHRPRAFLIRTELDLCILGFASFVVERKSSLRRVGYWEQKRWNVSQTVLSWNMSCSSTSKLSSVLSEIIHSFTPIQLASQTSLWKMESFEDNLVLCIQNWSFMFLCRDQFLFLLIFCYRSNIILLIKILIKPRNPLIAWQSLSCTASSKQI